MKKDKKKVTLPKVEKRKKPTLPDRVGISAKIPFQNLQSKSLFVATPMYGGQCFGMYARCIADLTKACSDLQIPLQIHFLFNESLIQRGRNYCCDEFLRARIGEAPPEGVEDNRPYYSHMLFIDSDIGFDIRDVIFMLGISDIGGDKDVVCAPYPKKCIAWEKIKVGVELGFADENPNNLERFVGDYVFNPKSNQPIQLNQPTEILEGGTGFMLIQRQAFEKFANKFPNQAYRPDHVRTKAFDGSREIYAFFDCVIDRGYTFDDVKALMEKAAAGEDVKELANAYLELEKKSSKRYLSEDYMFCQYLQKAGAKIWMLPWPKLSHSGSYVFSGSLPDLAALNVSLTADPSQLKHKK